MTVSMPDDPAQWARWSPQLDELLDLPPAERATRLSALRQTDPALAEELAALLARLQRLDDEAFLHQPALAPTPAQTGQRVGAYRLEREIGSGGMGSVWLARRDDGRYDGQVAIKFLHAGLFGRHGLARFEREGRVLARLDHPHIARLLDAGLALGPAQSQAHPAQPYLVLEYIPGEPIDAYCRRHALGVDSVLALFMDVLAAVSHAHNRLILHRDLKPSNILVTESGQVKLLDFGIAKLLDEAALQAADQELTRQAGLAYTLNFAAPEQVQGSEVSTATDVYALGVLLYLLLSGRHPTSAGAGTGTLEQLRAVAEQAPLRVSDAARSQGGTEAARRVRELQGDLDLILAKALKKVPAERYATAADLAQDLRRHRAHEPIAARPDSAAYVLAKFVRRHRLGLGAGAMALLGLVGGLGVALQQAHEARRQQVQAESLIEFMLGDLRRKLQPVGRLEVLDAVGAKALGYYASQNASRLDADSLGRRARALHLIGEIAETRGQLDEAEHRFREASQATAALLARSPDDGQRVFDQSQSDYWLGYIAWRKGDHAAAEAGFRNYLARAQQLVRIDPARQEWQAELAYAENNLGVLYLKMGRHPEALAVFDAARKIWEASVLKGPEHRSDLATTLGWLASASEALGQYQQAIDLEVAKLAVLAALPGAGSDRTVQYMRANASHAIARRLLWMGRLGPAGEAVQQALTQISALCRLDPSNLSWQSHLGFTRLLQVEILQWQGHPGPARAELDQNEEVLSRLLAAEPDSPYWQVQLRGMQLALRERLEPGRPNLLASLADVVARAQRFETSGKSLDAEQQRAATLAGLNYGDLLAAAGRPAQARALWQRLADHWRDSQQPMDSPTMALLADIDLRLGRLKEAAAWAEKLTASSYRHPDLADLRHRLAKAASIAPGPTQQE
jgi:serine/threonine protein kinase